MASVSRENIATLHDKIIVKLNKEDYYPNFEKSLKEYSKKVSIPGFRKGHVPSGMIKKMYGQAIFVEEVIKAGNNELTKYLEEVQPKIFGQALPYSTDTLKFDMNNPSDYELPYEIGLRPELDITPLNDKGSLARYVFEVTEKMIDDEVKNMRKKAGNIEDDDVAGDEEGVIYSTFQPCNEAGEIIQNKEEKEDVALYKELNPKIAEQIKNKAAGHTFVLKPQEIFDEVEIKEFAKTVLGLKDNNIENLASYYLFTLKNVRKIVEKELNEEFFAEVFPFLETKDETTFRNQIKEELIKEIYNIANQRLQNEIYEKLVHETPIELPVTFLKSWMSVSEKDKKGELLEKTPEQIDEEYPGFEHRLRWSLISDKLINDFGVKVGMEEVRELFKNQVIKYFGISNGDENNASWLSSYVDNMMKDEKGVEETYNRLILDRLFDNIARVIEVKDEIQTEEEFKNYKPKQNYHNHN